jgi:hypothetical protein
MGPLHDPDMALSRFASRRHGVVSRSELAGLGLSPRQIARRAGAGRLVRVHRGVYAVGHTALTREGRWMAAVLAVGGPAVLSHNDAAAAWGLEPARGARIDVTTPVRNGRAAPASIRLHRVHGLEPFEVTVRDTIPITTPARTLLDRAAALDTRALEDLIAQAVRLDLFDLRPLRWALTLRPTRAGSPRLAALLDRLEGAGPADTRSPAEVAMLRLCDAYGLPAPLVNVPVEGYTIDFAWPGTRLLVEVDGYQFHSMPTAFESDRERDQVLTVAGYVVARFTKRQVERTPRVSAERLRALITACSGAPHGP